eukprot:scaffold1505_cov146-Skeletonema_marinoi.AAC.6
MPIRGALIMPHKLILPLYLYAPLVPVNHVRFLADENVAMLSLLPREDIMPHKFRYTPSSFHLLTQSYEVGKCNKDRYTQEHTASVV